MSSNTTILTPEEEEINKKEKKPLFTVITGGKGPPEPPRVEGDWLYTLRNNVVFIAREKNSKAPWCLPYKVLQNDPDRVCNLAVINLDGTIHNAWVVTEDFSKQFEMIEIILAPENNEEENDGKSNRSDNTRPLDNDEDVVVIDEGRE